MVFGVLVLIFLVFSCLVFLLVDSTLNHSHQYELILTQSLGHALENDMETYWREEWEEIEVMTQDQEVRFSNVNPSFPQQTCITDMKNFSATGYSPAHS